MGFNQKDVDKLLAETGRRCCICSGLHKIQVHHIVPKSQGGSDDIENGISLCPNCHDEVHCGFAPGRATRIYNPDELKLHKQRTIDQVKKESKWKPGSQEWEQDKDLLLFFSQCLDRPAFRTYFQQELSYVAFDQAMEDTLIALNTGYWRLRDRTLIERKKGKSCIVNPDWRNKLDQIAKIIEGIRERFQNALGLDQMFSQYRHRPEKFREFDIEDSMEFFRHEKGLGKWMDTERNKAIELINSILDELSIPSLQGIRLDS